MSEKFHQLSHDPSMIRKKATDNSLLRPASERVTCNAPLRGWISAEVHQPNELESRAAIA
jgi:hypothetical protein